MPRHFLNEREGKQGGGLTDPFMNPERNAELEATGGGASRLCLRTVSFRRRRWRAGFICDALFWDGAVHGLFLVDLYQASFVGGEVA